MSAYKINEADAADRVPATSARDQQDREKIIMAKGLMGWLMVVGLFHIMGLRYGDNDFEQALQTASRSQLNAMLLHCQQFIADETLGDGCG